MNSKNVWSTTLHEMRIQRRLLRTHLFIWFALIISTVYFVAVTLNHMHGASTIPMLGVISPRYIMSLLSGSFVVLFCIGVLLLTSDHVNRDKSCRIYEVIGSKPLSNFEFYLGKLFGVTLTMATPVVFFLVAIVTFGFITEVFSLKFGEPVELWSVVSFVLLDIAPNFLFFGSLVILFSTMFKSRLVTLLLTLGCLSVIFWLNSRLPLDISRPMQTVTGKVLFPSELVPTLLTPIIVCNRIALLLMSAGILCWTSCIEVRITKSRSMDLVLGSLSFVSGLVLIGTMFGAQTLEHNQINLWVETHDEHFNPSSFPDVQGIRGSIDLNPGRSITIDLTIDVSVDTDHDSDFILFSLNPGYNIAPLVVDGVEVKDYEFQHGLLKVPSKYFSTELTKLEIGAIGRPDKRFAYLDSRETLSRIIGPEVRQLRHLGSENSIFRSEFVALLPGIKWYPTSGTATNEDNWVHRERDFFVLDVEVSVPRNWLVAGPAKREQTGNNNHNKYRFRQSSPISDFALVGSRFESASLDIEGISFEVLYSEMHSRTFESLGKAENSMRDRLKHIVEMVRNRGFDYPYGSLTLVEVPATLRVFGGGVSMDTVMCPPGIIMIRESTLPTTSATSFYEIDRYLHTPMFESNVIFGFFRAILGQQTNATQEGAHAVNLLLELMFDVIMFPFIEAEFDFHIALDRKLTNLASVEPMSIFRTYSRRQRNQIIDEIYRVWQSIKYSSEVWDAAESSSLYDPVLEENSTLTFRGMRFRCQQLVQYIVDTIGVETSRTILLDMLNRFRGQNFVFSDFIDVFADHGFNLLESSGDLVSTAGLPGFLVSRPTMQQLEADNQVKYETTFVLRNGEPVSGPVRIVLTYQNEKDTFSLTEFPLPTMVVGANQARHVVIESSNPVLNIWVNPYLSLNRIDLKLDLPKLAEWQEQEFVHDDSPVIKSSEEIDLEHDASSSFITDDLDPGFSIVGSSTPLFGIKFSQLMLKIWGEEYVPLDNGIPQYRMNMNFRSANQVWARWNDPTAFGTYRRTFALTQAGDGSVAAKFSTILPEEGKWQLEYYRPEGHFWEETKRFRGSGRMFTMHSFCAIDIEVEADSGVVAHSFDAYRATPGWNTIGNFDLTSVDVDVVVSNQSDRGCYVIADAIQWAPVETKE